MDTIGNHLEEARLQAQMSQVDAAIACGVDSKTIGRWERGHRFPRADNIVVLSRVYDRSADELLGLDPHFKPRKRTPHEKRAIVNGWQGWS